MASGPPITCFLRSGPLPGTSARIVSGAALSTCMPMDRMEAEAGCGVSCQRSPHQGSTQTRASHPRASLLSPVPSASLYPLLHTPPHRCSCVAGSHSFGDEGGALVTDSPFSYPSQGRFTIAAKHHISIAEIYETELVDIEKVSDSQALPGQWQGGLHQPVLWDQDSSLYSCPSGEVL